MYLSRSGITAWSLPPSALKPSIISVLTLLACAEAAYKLFICIILHDENPVMTTSKTILIIFLDEVPSSVGRLARPDIRQLPPFHGMLIISLGGQK